MTNKLEILIDQAYRLFAKYQLGNEMAVCTHCCLSKEHETMLRTQPLQSLDIIPLSQYLEAAHSEYDEQLIEQMRYLLPRILELIVEGRAEELHFLPEVVLQRLYCDHSSWKQAELNFLNTFVETYLHHLITVGNFDDIMMAVCIFDNARLPVTFLDKVFNHILQNADDIHFMESMIYLANISTNFCHNSSESLNKKMTQFFQSDNFKNAYLNAILRKLEDDNYDNLSQDEKNLYEVAFSIFSSL